jgi:glycosyltransferase involved in cell wall biosynthesis
MKIVALVAFKNEEVFLKNNLPQLSQLCDMLIGHDDNSTDNSKEIFTQHGGIIIPRSRSLDWANGGQFQVRQSLLRVGREEGGTHFICLDADELFTADVTKNLRTQIAGLSPGYALCFKWINCWADPDSEEFAYDPQSVIYKDFIFADAAGLEIPFGMIHFSRTPTNVSSHVRSVSDGGVLHLQNFNFANFIAKQLWYQLNEVVFNNYPYYYVEHKYLYFTRKPDGLISVKPHWIEDFPQLDSEPRLSTNWRIEIVKVLAEVEDPNIQFLALWDYPFLSEIYEEFYGVKPRPKTLLRISFDQIRLKFFVFRSSVASWRSKNSR